MFLTFWVCYFIILRDFSTKSLLIMISSLIIFAIGMVDDWYKIKGSDLKALPKLIVQLSACVLVFISGVRFRGFTNPLDSGYILLPGWLQFSLTVTWMFGVTTVINFMDGLDGLAGTLMYLLLHIVYSRHGQGKLLFGHNGHNPGGICLGYLKYNKFL